MRRLLVTGEPEQYASVHELASVHHRHELAEGTRGYYGRVGKTHMVCVETDDDVQAIIDAARTVGSVTVQEMFDPGPDEHYDLLLDGGNGGWRDRYYIPTNTSSNTDCKGCAHCEK